MNMEPLPRRAWLTVALLWFVACLNYLDRLILITMRTSIKDSLDVSPLGLTDYSKVVETDGSQA